ncbi:CpaD family pilus assembly protein [Vibrio makurazakiensis]|uniref:CpaD family pilus assembly lipoprotein n=1 Tax=Vibrio makurazakiensis TaxID=2910250 RepID=UPI003D0C2333
MKRATLLLPILLTVAGCAPTPITREPSVDVVAVTNKLTLNLSGTSLTTEEKADIQQFVQRRGVLSNLKIKLESNTAKGKKQLKKVEIQLLSNGIYPSQITRVDGSSTQSGDIVILAESYRAKVPACNAGKASKSVMSSYKKQNNFGCANASALAQMVANPKDLIVGESLGHTQGEKAVSTIDRYLAPPVQSSQAEQTSLSATLGAK